MFHTAGAESDHISASAFRPKLSFNFSTPFRKRDMFRNIYKNNSYKNAVRAPSVSHMSAHQKHAVSNSRYYVLERYSEQINKQTKIAHRRHETLYNEKSLNLKNKKKSKPTKENSRPFYPLFRTAMRYLKASIIIIILKQYMAQSRR